MQEPITKLKKRRDDLLSRACSRQELPNIMKEVQALNREIQALEEKKQAK